MGGSSHQHRRTIGPLLIAPGIVLSVWFVVSTNDGAPVADRGTVILPMAVPEPRVSLAAPVSPDPVGDATVAIGSSLPRIDSEVALLDERFAAQPSDDSSGSRAIRLQSQLERLSKDAASFADLTVTCRETMCRLSGGVTNAHAAASRSDAFELLHLPEITTIAASERLEPGPQAILTTISDRPGFVAYLVAP